MNSKQMRWISYIILAAMLLPLLVACSGRAEEVSTATEISSSSAQSASAPQSMSASSSASQSKSVTYSNATIEDVPVIMAEKENGDYEYLYEKQKEKYEAEKDLAEPDYLAMADNESPLQELLKKNSKKVPASDTWGFSYGFYNSEWYKGVDYSENNHSINLIQKIIGFDVAFTRTVGEFYDEQRSEQAIRMYTVFESEAGGYIYCFFNYYPESQYTLVRGTTYQPFAVSYDDVCTIEKGDDIKDLTQIEPFTLKIQRNLEDGMQGLYQIVIYLTNEKTHAISFDMEGKVQASSELEDNIVRNPWPAEYYGGGDGIVGDEFSPWNIYDFTILPQDYPPA